MKALLYWIDLKTGKVTQGGRPDHLDGLETYGYKTAQAVSRLVKKGDLDGALMAANNGIEWAARKD